MSAPRRSRSDLRAGQQFLAGRIKGQPKNFLAAGIGVGKTGATLAAVRDLLDEGAVARVLIIAPLLVAEDTWPNEIEMWDFARPLTFELLTGSIDRREFRAKIEADLHIVNRELVPWLVDFWGEDWPYDMVVIDEFQSFKNPRKRSEPTKTQIKAAEEAAREAVDGDEEKYPKLLKRELSKIKRNYTRFGALCRVLKHIDYMVGLTGTPSPNGLLDLWAPTYLLDQGQRLGATFSAFRDRWFKSDFRGYTWAPHEHSHGEIMERLSDIMVAMRTEDYAELPEVSYNTIRAPLPDKAMKEYRQFERTLVSQMYDVSAQTQGVLINKLLQFASGSMYREDETIVAVHDVKLRSLENLVEEAGGAPLLVAYNFKFDLERILKKFPQAVFLGDDSSAIKRWNQGKIRMLVGHPASMGAGLNLQHGGHIAVWYGVSFNLEHYLQFNGRLYRPGQKNKVMIHHIVAPGTADERVLAALQSKGATQDSVMDAAKVVVG